MSEINHPRLKAVFIGALDLEGEARARFLDEHCAGDKELRARVEALLVAAVGPGSGPTIDAKPSPSDTNLLASAITPLTEGPGTRIGPYKLLQRIGEGGFGTVFMAEQEHPVRRRVALKIIKLGMDTRAVVARFEQERQALAMMDHPNIAKVLDAGPAGNHNPSASHLQRRAARV